MTLIECDYLVVGTGASGMAFVDSLIQGLLLQQQQQQPTKIVLMDEHAAPGGQWHDSYEFVQLHQPSALYGVESMPLEPPQAPQDHRATRQEILNYYAAVLKKWQETAKNIQVEFIGNATFVWEENTTDSRYFYVHDSGHHSIQVRKRLVDARYLQPDLPVTTRPKFDFDSHKVCCVPVNSLVEIKKQYYVVIGGGKTGMDAVMYLLSDPNNVPAHNVMWIVPHDPWITARENMGNCMEFLHTAVQLSQSSSDLSLQSTELVQQTFLKWEQEGKIYRLFPDNALPTKFNDATLSRDELQLLQSLPSSNVIRGQGRVKAIDSKTGALVMQNGKIIALPWASNSNCLDKTVYVHCSAGAFHYTRQQGQSPQPIFSPNKVIVQDVYGTPGFCFVGSLLGKLTSLVDAGLLTNEQANAMCLAPQPPPCEDAPSTGTVVGFSQHHNWVQRLSNLRSWLQVACLRDWLVGHRLFHLSHYASADDIERLVVHETWNVLQQEGLVE